MPSVNASRPLSHLPAAPSPAAGTIVVTPGTSKQTTLPVTTAGNRPLVLAGKTVSIDPTMHSPENVVALINNANIPGVTASLDRYGQLSINGVSSVSGDNTLLQHLGLA